MSQLEVVLQVPKYIETGLANGDFRRVGGVIVHAQSGQIIAWLRDGSLLNPVNALDEVNALTIGGLLQGQLKNIARLTVTGQLLSLSMTVASQSAVLRKLNDVTLALSMMERQIIDEFRRNRNVYFKTALMRVTDALESENEDNRRIAAHDAIRMLDEAYGQFRTDLENHKEHSFLPIELAHENLINLMQVIYSRTCCYLEIGEPKRAKQVLKETIDDLKSLVPDLVRRWLGDHPAVFLHREVGDEEVQQFFRIQLWLKEEDGNDLNQFLTILHSLRSDFWNEDVIADEYDSLVQRATRRPTLRHSERVRQLSQRLNSAELLIENFKRLLGFEIELRTLRLVYKEWKTHIARLTTDADITERDFVLIHDLQVADQFNLSA